MNKTNIVIGLSIAVLVAVFLFFSPKTLPMTQSELRWAQKIEASPEGSLVINSDNTIFAKVLTRSTEKTILQYVEKNGLVGSGQVGAKSLANVEWIVTPDSAQYSKYTKEYNHLALQEKGNQV
jgi:hypothetical protein